MVGRANRRGWGFIRKLPSKRYQASYLHELARHTAPNTFSAKTDAERWLADERRAIEREEWVAPALRVAEKKAKAITLGEYANTWLAERNIKERTRLHYRSLLDRQIKPLHGTPLKNLSPDTVRAWHATLDKNHPRVNSHAYGLLHAICATAVTDGLLVGNPCQIKRAMATPRKRQPVILTVAEVAQLADEIRPERLKAFILIAAWCGTRFGETTELRRRDVSEDCSVITVSRGVVHRGGCRIDTPKSGRGREVIVPPHIRPVIKQHLKKHVDKDRGALLFPPARGGCHMNDKVFRDYLNPALEKIGRPGASVHDLRHFTGTSTARVGNLRETMDRLGHSTVGASIIYQSIASGRDAAVAEALSQLAEPDTPNDS